MKMINTTEVEEMAETADPNYTDFRFRVVFFHQPGCVACNTMMPVWNSAAKEIAEEFPHFRVGFGEFDTTTDSWEFADAVGVDGTPNFAVFDEEGTLLGLNTDGILARTQLKDFIIKSIETTKV